MKQTVTYHIRIGQRRTTISLDKIVSELLALKLGCQPETFEAHRAAQQYLQKTAQQVLAPDMSGVSAWITRWVLLELVDNILSKRHAAWVRHRPKSNPTQTKELRKKPKAKAPD